VTRVQRGVAAGAGACAVGGGGLCHIADAVSAAADGSDGVVGCVGVVAGDEDGAGVFEDSARAW
jgi:hypothetical protein